MTDAALNSMREKSVSNTYEVLDPTQRDISVYVLPRTVISDENTVKVGLPDDDYAYDHDLPPKKNLEWEAKVAGVPSKSFLPAPIVLEPRRPTNDRVQQARKSRLSRSACIVLLIVCIVILFLLLSIAAVLSWHFLNSPSSSSNRDSPVVGPQQEPAENEKNTCGARLIKSSAAQPYIINGEQVLEGAWPWYVRLNYKQYLQCGAVLVNERWIMTSAFCTYRFHREHEPPGNISDAVTYVGLTNISAMGQVEGIGIDQIVMHPNYVPNKATRGVWLYDIALLRLKKKIEFSDTVQPICLPDESSLKSVKRCYMAGFGETKYYNTDKPTSDILLQTQLNPIPEQKCREAISQLGGDATAATTEDFKSLFCAQPVKTSSSPCRGDGGGGLMCQTPSGSWIVTGVYSSHFGDCQINFFANVAYYRDWIAKTINENHMEAIN